MECHFVTFRDIVSETERVALQEYALKLKDANELVRNPAGRNRYYQCIWGGPLVTPLISELAIRIEERFGLKGTPVDPELGWVISVIYHGGFVHPHKDDRLYRDRPVKHLRCNVVISKPETGGTPIIARHPVPLIEGGGWAFFASEVEHSAFPVSGSKPRVIYQFGYAVPLEWKLPLTLITSR